VRTLGFTIRLAMSTSVSDFHRLDLCHARHTQKTVTLKNVTAFRD